MVHVDESAFVGQHRNFYSHRNSGLRVQTHQHIDFADFLAVLGAVDLLQQSGAVLPQAISGSSHWNGSLQKRVRYSAIGVATFTLKSFHFPGHANIQAPSFPWCVLADVRCQQGTFHGLDASTRSIPESGTATLQCLQT